MGFKEYDKFDRAIHKEFKELLKAYQALMERNKALEKSVELSTAEFNEQEAIERFNAVLTPDNGADLSALEGLERSRFVQGARWQFEKLTGRSSTRR